MRVALAFFGITRSLRYTLPSIQAYLFSPLRAHKISYDVFVHTYRLSSYYNVRTNEQCARVNNEEYKLLKANYVQCEDQDAVKRKIGVEKYRTHPDPWDTQYNSVDNFILAQYSKSQVTRMIQGTKQEYDYILYVRPDVRYLQPLKPEWFAQSTETCIGIPNFHLYGSFQFNDRIAITNMKTYIIYGDTFPSLLETSKKMSLHSETVLAKRLKEHRITWKYLPFIFVRIRCDGQVAPLDADFLKIE
jgi:hypothetical protein